MDNAKFTLEEEIRLTRDILEWSYDLGNCGIPPQTRLLEELLGGQSLSEDAQKTFRFFYGSNLFFILGRGGEMGQIYFGNNFETLAYKSKVMYQIDLELVGATIRNIAYPTNPLDFRAFNMEAESQGVIEEFVQRGYLSKRPKPVNEWAEAFRGAPYSLNKFVMSIIDHGGDLTREGIDAMEQSNEKLLTEPFKSRCVQLHTQKLDIMVRILEYTIKRVSELAFADVNKFNPAAYFKSEYRALEYLQKYFGGNVPSAVELLNWAKGILSKAPEKYVNPPKIS